MILIMNMLSIVLKPIINHHQHHNNFDEGNKKIMVMILI